MKCHACQHNNPPGLKFCGECGTRLSLLCSSCGAANEPAQKFCGECGTKLASEPIALASPASYTPKHLAEKILTSRSALEGERKQVTVLFCDISNSTEMADRAGAETMHDILHRFFELALEEVHRYEGTVNQFLGDGFMALFGAPVAHEDHARRAVLAATGLRKALAEQQDRLGLLPGAELRVRIGLNTGPVVVGSIGDNLRMDYTAIGDTTNLAARLQQHAPPSEIFVSEATARLVEGSATLEKLAPFLVKGKSEPIHAFRLIAATSHRARLDQGRALSPFVGRGRELDALRAALEEALAGRGQIVGILGEPGAGKSRLLHELRQLLAGRDVTYLEGWCQSFGQSIPYLPLQDLLRAACGMEEGDATIGIQQKLNATLGAAGLNAEPSFPYLLRMLGIKEGAEQVEQIGPETIQARIREHFVLLILSLSRVKPIVLVIEDLHWMDRSSEECMGALAENLAGSSVLLLASTRPGYNAPWTGKSYSAQVSLRALASDAARMIVTATIERTEQGADMTEDILKKAEGNPFFLEELALAITGRSRRGQALPDTVQGVIAARIDRLPDDAKHVLQTAAILGREFPFRLLEAISDAPELQRQLSALKQQEFLFERTAPEGSVYTFKHVLTQVVAYDSLLNAKRQALHEAAGRTLEVLHAEHAEQYCEIIAHHYSCSANTQKAIDYLEMANVKAIRANALADAQRYFNDARRLYDRIPDSGESRRKQVELLVVQSPTFMLQMKMREYEQLLLASEAAAVKLGDDGLLGRLYACLGHCAWFFGRLNESLEINYKAAQLCEQKREFAGAGHARMLVLWNHLYLGRYPCTVDHQALALSALEKSPNLRYWLWSKTATSFGLAFMGQYARAKEEAHQALDLGERMSDASFVSFAAFVLSIAYLCEGDSDAAVAWGQRAWDVAPTTGDRAWAQIYLGWAKARQSPGSGMAELEPLIPVFRSVEFPAAEMLTIVALGDAYLLAGRPEDAKRVLKDAIDLTSRTDVVVWLEFAHRLMGEALMANGGSTSLAEAESHFQKAIQLCVERQAEGELAATYAAYGRLKAQEAQVSQAREFLAQALALFEKLGTLAQPERVRAELAALAN